MYVCVNEQNIYKTLVTPKGRHTIRTSYLTDERSLCINTFAITPSSKVFLRAYTFLIAVTIVRFAISPRGSKLWE